MRLIWVILWVACGPYLDFYTNHTPHLESLVTCEFGIFFFIPPYSIRMSEKKKKRITGRQIMM